MAPRMRMMDAKPRIGPETKCQHCSSIDPGKQVVRTSYSHDGGVCLAVKLRKLSHVSNSSFRGVLNLL